MKDGMTDKEKRDWIEKRIEFIGEHEKIMQRIKDKSEVAKEVNLVVDLDIHRKLLKEAKLSQRKEDIEMFEKMIDEWSKEQITRPSPLTFDIEDLKQKLKEMKK